MIIEDTDSLTLIESELEYNNYLAQKVFFDELAVLSIKFSESTYILEADIKQTVMSYIRKVVANIQAAWNKFKTKITNTVWNTIKEKYATELEMDREYQITEVNDNDVFVDWKAIDTFYNANNTSTFVTNIDMNDGEGFDEVEMFKKLYPSFAGMDLKKLSTGAATQWIIENKKMFPKMKVGDVLSLNANINTYKKELDNIESKTKPIENALKAFNEMEKQIEAAVRNAENRVQAPTDNGTNVNVTNNSAITASSMYDTLLTEVTNYVTEFKGQDAADPEGLEANGGKKANNNIYQKTAAICKLFTTGLSVMMNILNKASNKSISIVLKYVRNASKYRNKTEDQGKTVETPTENPNNGTQVKTNANG